MSGLPSIAWRRNVGHGPAVVGTHARAVGVEDARDARVHALLAVVGHGHRLGVALGLVVHAARAERIDVAPVGLGLRVHQRVAVDLGGRRQEQAGTLELGQAERVVRAVGAHLEGVQRQAQVVDGGGRAGEVEDVVHPAFDVDELGQVDVAEVEAVVADVLDVLQRPRVEVVEAHDLVILGEQALTQVRAQESGSAGHHRAFHHEPPFHRRPCKSIHVRLW